jgi:AraC family transcriptional regulator, regulatory protein of adaptative response / methylated-DNA-[protein]-cysteine methyltransferase
MIRIEMVTPAPRLLSTFRIDSPIGPLLAGAVPEGVCLLEFFEPERLGPQVLRLARWLGAETSDAETPPIAELRRQLKDYFAGRRASFEMPLVVPGTPFQRRVWDSLVRIPYGETRSYEELARSIGSANGMRAVGTANGQNRIAIVIPCHRVVNKSGTLGGYGGGLWRKEFLLKLEGVKLEDAHLQGTRLVGAQLESPGDGGDARGAGGARLARKDGRSARAARRKQLRLF